VFRGRPRGGASVRLPAGQSWAMVRHGSGISRGNCSPGAIQIVDRFHVKETRTAPLSRSLEPATSRASYGQLRAARNSTKANFAPSCVPCDRTPSHPPPRRNADCTSTATATECAIRGSANKGSARHPASSKPDAKSLSALVSSAPVCIGPSRAQTPSSPSVAATSAVDFRISGNEEMTLSPLDYHFPAVHPFDTLCWRLIK
jgi:hypothetical protein